LTGPLASISDELFCEFSLELRQSGQDVQYDPADGVGGADRSVQALESAAASIEAFASVPAWSEPRSTTRRRSDGLAA